MDKLRFLLLTTLLGSPMYGADVHVPLDDGDLLIHAWLSGTSSREFWYSVINETSSPWIAIRMDFTVSLLCNGETRRFTMLVGVSIGWLKERQIEKNYNTTLIPLTGDLSKCSVELLTANVVYAVSPTTRIDGVTGDRVVFAKQLEEAKARRDAEAAEQSERDREAAEEKQRAADEQTKKDAVEASRQRRLAAEQKRKQAEENSKYAKMKADEMTKAVQERRTIRMICTGLYKKTADKKVNDLTVREEQQVRTCQALGFYVP